MIGKELIYDKNLSLFERFYIAVFGIPINGLRIRARRILPLIQNDAREILDVGCGQGIFTFEIARRQKKSLVTGIDIEKKLLERNKQIVQKIGLKNCHFEYGDITDEIKIGGKYDLVLSIDLLEHIKDDEKVLKNLWMLLKKDGKLILHVPAYYRKWIFFKWTVNFEVEGHERPGYTKEEITQKIKKAGFKINEVYYTYGWLETVTNNISYLITQARMTNKLLYAFIFPLLHGISWFGQWSYPSKGAGIMVMAKK